MSNDGQNFLEQLSTLAPDSFEHRFSTLSRELGLCDLVDRNELMLLFDVSLCASLCNRAFNEPDCKVKTMRGPEANRTRRELDFMTARDIFYGSPGWQQLDALKQEAIEEAFLSISVGEECMAW